MVWLIDHCSMVMTDSGGLQKEAYFFAKPCITMRDQTEWVELVQAGANVLTGADKTEIVAAYQAQKAFDTERLDETLYGGGRASERIVSELLND